MISLRRAESGSDLALCAEIWLTASCEAHNFVDAAYWREHQAAMRDYYLPASRVRIAEKNGLAAGFSAMHENRLEALFVSPPFWSQGVGSALLREILASFGAVSLSVYAENTRALNFYINHGFRLTGRSICPHTGAEEIGMLWTRNEKR